MSYHSFLLCFHPGHTDVFRNGLPLGVVCNNEFKLHQHVMPGGKLMTVEMPETLPALVREVLDMMDEQQATAKALAGLTKASP